MKRSHLVTGCAIMALCSASGVAAQDAGGSGKAGAETAAAPAAQPASGSQSSLEEIVVTAQRRSEKLQNVPIAVTATTSARLEATGVTSTQSLGLVTPGLTVPQTAGYTQPRIRGVGSSVNGPGFEPPVATYIDGVYMASSPASLLTLNNISRVEVLKGPQGTLFGRNATGGLINAITRDPQQTPSADIKLTYANYQDLVADTYVTAGLTDSLAGDLAVRYEHQNRGWGTNLATGHDVGRLDHDFAARTKLLFKPVEGTELRLALDYQDRLSSRNLQKPIDRFYPISFNNPFFGGPYNLGSGRYDINATVDPYGNLKAGGASLQINQDLGGVSLQSITAYRKSKYTLIQDVDYVPAFVTSLADTARNNQFSEELQLSSKSGGPLTWVAGLFYFHSRDRNAPEDIAFGPTPISPIAFVPVTIVVNDQQNTDSYAGYAQATYELLKDTNLTLGGRYTYEKKRLSGTLGFFVAGNLAAEGPVSDPASGIPDHLTFKRFNYRIALDHKFTPDVLGYVSYNTGFKSGGFNLNLPSDPPYKPEDIKAAEVGLKSELFNHRVRLNVAAYYYNYDNIQVGRYIAGNTSIYNGAKAEIYGADLDAQILVTNQLTLTGGFAYNHAEFKKFPVSDYFVPINGCIPTPVQLCSASANGNTLPFSPKTTFSIGADYNILLPGGSELMLNALYFRSSLFYGASDNVSFQPAYDLVNAAVTWTDASQKLSIRAWAKNIGNTTYATSILESTAANVVTYGDPRTYGVTLGFKY